MIDTAVKVTAKKTKKQALLTQRKLYESVLRDILGGFLDLGQYIWSNMSAVTPMIQQTLKTALLYPVAVTCLHFLDSGFFDHVSTTINSIAEGGLLLQAVLANEPEAAENQEDDVVEDDDDQESAAKRVRKNRTRRGGDKNRRAAVGEDEQGEAEHKTEGDLKEESDDLYA